MIELGISTFGETTPLESSKQPIPHDVRLRQLVAEMQLADQVGLDVYAIGEHHRADFAVSAPEVVLAAGASVTERIRLSSAVTVLSSADPVRVYQNFATLDGLSQGRAELMVGRGSFTESFPLFGYDLAHYDSLFTEKLAMLRAIAASEHLDWTGRHTQSVSGKGVYPRFIQQEAPIWVATGGNPASTVSIAEQGLPIAYAIIGGNPLSFKKLIDLYRAIGSKQHPEKQLAVAAHSWGFIADSDESAAQQYFYPTKFLIDTISKDRPHWSPLTEAQYQHAIGPDGAMLVGSPDTVAQKMIQTIEALQLDRFLLHLPIGSMPHEAVLHAIELFGTKVAPQVRKQIAYNRAQRLN